MVSPSDNAARSVYQEKAGRRSDIEGQYVFRSAGKIGFEIGAYDRSMPLVIDPQIVYQLTIFGGVAVATDATGNAYVARQTGDATVRKLDPQGIFVYEYFIGGTDFEYVGGVAVAADGSTVLAGATSSELNFPTTPGAFDRTFDAVTITGFVARFDTAGVLVYSTFLGGDRYDAPSSVALDADGNTYVGGATASSDFPTTGTGYQPIKTTGYTWTNAFLAVLNPTASALIYSTYFGGTVGTIHPLTTGKLPNRSASYDWFTTESAAGEECDLR